MEPTLLPGVRALPARVPAVRDLPALTTGLTRRRGTAYSRHRAADDAAPVARPTVGQPRLDRLPARLRDVEAGPHQCASSRGAAQASRSRSGAADAAPLDPPLTTRVACLGDWITEGSPYLELARSRAGDPQGQWHTGACCPPPGARICSRTTACTASWGRSRSSRGSKRPPPAPTADRAGRNRNIAQGRCRQAAHNISVMIDRGLAGGLRVAVCDVLPWNNGWPRTESAIRRLNELVRDLGVPVLPFHDTLEDPSRPGRMKPEWAHEDGDLVARGTGASARSRSGCRSKAARGGRGASAGGGDWWSCLAQFSSDAGFFPLVPRPMGRKGWAVRPIEPPSRQA